MNETWARINFCLTCSDAEHRYSWTSRTCSVPRGKKMKRRVGEVEAGEDEEKEEEVDEKEEKEEVEVKEQDTNE